MKAFKLLAYVAALGCGSLMGCAPKPASHYSVYIDPTMNASDTDAMLSALQSWEQSVPVTFDVTIGAPFGKEEHTIVITCTTIAQVRLLAPGSGDIGVTRRNASTDVYVRKQRVRRGEYHEHRHQPMGIASLIPGIVPIEWESLR